MIPDLLKMRYKAGIIMLFVTVVSTTSLPKCERAPTHAQPADAFYRLGVAGEPDLFLPGELYTGNLYIL